MKAFVLVLAVFSFAIFAASMFFAPKAQAAFLSGYGFRKEIPISRPSGAVTDYQMKLKVGETAGADSYTKALIEFDGADESTNVIDETGKTVTAHGTAQIDTSQKVFGTAAGSMSSQGDYFSIADSDDFTFDADNFTIDMRVRLNSTSGYVMFFEKVQGSDWNNYMQFFRYETTGKLYFQYKNGGITKADYASDNSLNLSTDTWYHLAVVRDGNNLKFYLDGNEIAMTANTSVGTNSLDAISADLEIGGSGVDRLNGWIDELRISKGIARWTSNFTPPTQEYKLEDIDLGGHAQTDFDDLRFTKADGTTNLDYWIESIEGTTPNQVATVWVEFDSIGTTDTTFYMYYGNSSATAASSGEDTFEFFDGFDDGSVNGTLWDTNETPNESGSEITFNSSLEGIKSKSAFQYKRLLTKAFFTEGAFRNWLGFKNAIDQNATEQTVFAQVNSDPDDMYTQNYLTDYVSSNEGSGFTDEYHVFQIDRVSSSAINYYIDNNLLQSAITQIPTANLNATMFNGSDGGGPVTDLKIDWIAVSNLIDVEPTFGTFGSEEEYTPPSCTGGTETTDGDYKIHTFTTVGSDTLTCSQGGEVEYLLVAGGGGSGSSDANGTSGGGGGGGVLTGTTTITNTENSIVVGDGGVAETNGEDSTIFGLTAVGGGKGASNYGTSAAGTGGSGGGGSSVGGANPHTSGAAGTGGQGYAGGDSLYASYAPAGGGGGASEDGADGVEASPYKAGDGGDGIQSSISGTATYYGGGGGGGSAGGSGDSAAGHGGLGGGGNGNEATGGATDGTANTGGGGGGNYGTGKSGGSGIVIVRYLSSETPPSNFSCVSNGTGGGDWSEASTWIDCNSTVPQAGDSVTIADGDTVTIDSGLTINEIVDLTVIGTLTQSNILTQTITGTLTIQDGGVLNHCDNSTEQICEVNFAAANIDVQSGGSINVDGLGYDGGINKSDGYGDGAGKGSPSYYAASGAGYGGNGGIGWNIDVAGSAYCDASDIQDIGSGGGSGGDGIVGGSGGGLIILNVSETLTIDGSISAKGNDGGTNYYGGGGSGGGINIIADTIAGTYTSFSVSGGAGGYYGAGGGGGGGCAYLEYTTSNSIEGNDENVSMNGGASRYNNPGWHGGAGVFVTKKSDDTDTKTYIINGGTEGAETPWVDSSLTEDYLYIANKAIYTQPTGETLTPNNITIDDATFNVEGTLTLNNESPYVLNLDTAEINVDGGALTINISDADELNLNSSTLNMISGLLDISDSDTPDNITINSGTIKIEGGTLTLPNDLTISSTNFEFWQTANWTDAENLDLTVRDSSAFTQGYFTTETPFTINSLTIQDGGTVTHLDNSTAQTHIVNISAPNITIDSGGSINVDGLGYDGGYGEIGGAGNAGMPYAGGGGAHGGNGGEGSGGADGGTAYCDIANPQTMGSGGGAGGYGEAFGSGGGLIMLDVSGTLTVNGAISAKGNNGGTDYYGGGGGGGGINITANVISGTPESFLIAGGAGGYYGAGGGGGGGCAYLEYTTSNSIEGNDENVSMNGGASRYNNPGWHGGAGVVLTNKSDDSETKLCVINGGTEGAETPQIAETLTPDSATISQSAIFSVPAGKTFSPDNLSINSATVKVDGGSLNIDDNELNSTAGIVRIINNGTITTPSSFSFSSTTLELWQTATWTNTETLDLTVGNDSIFTQGYFTTETPFTINSLTIQGGVTGGIVTHLDNSTLQTHVVNISADTIDIQEGGSINVDGKGYDEGNGLGVGQSLYYAGGGAHGGNGSNDYYYGNQNGGTAYCDITNPQTIGSGGGNGSWDNGGGSGGGLIILNVTNT